MDPINFVYWLQGYFELAPPDCLTPEQVKVIQDHLNLVLHKVTPGKDTPQEAPTPPQTRTPSSPLDSKAYPSVTRSTLFC